MFRFEHREEKPISKRHFAWRMLHRLGIAFVPLLLILGLGMLGYHHFEDMEWIDSFLNASMILSGMGPANDMTTFGGKLFAGVYALFSGLVFVALAGFLIAPVVHRILHRFHYEEEDQEES
jgi:hypothetical protein